MLRSCHSFISTYLLLLILSIIPSFSLVFEIGLVLMVFRLIGSHLISHLALKQSRSMIPSLHSLLSPVVYPKVPYLAHSFLLSILLLLSRWSQTIPSNTINTLMTPSCTSLSHLQILLYLLKHLYQHFHWHSFLDELEQTASQSIQNWIPTHWYKTTAAQMFST